MNNDLYQSYFKSVLNNSETKKNLLRFNEKYLNNNIDNKYLDKLKYDSKKNKNDSSKITDKFLSELKK